MKIPARPYHLLLAGPAVIFPILARNPGTYPPGDLPLALLTVLAVTSFLLLALRALGVSLRRAAAPASLCTIACFQAFEIRRFVELRLNPSLDNWFAEHGPSAIVLLLLGAALVAVGSTPARIDRMNRATTLFMVSLLALQLPALYELRFPRPTEARAPGPNPTPEPPGPARTPEALSRPRPNIYFIVLDALASTPVMSREFGHDNRAWNQQLEQLGFNVCEDARSNYFLSPISIASILNLDYVEHLVPKTGDKLPYAEFSRLINDSALRRHLGGLGYRFIGLSTAFEPLEPKSADRYVHLRGSTLSLTRHLIERTPAASFAGTHGTYRKWIQKALDEIPLLAADLSPALLYAHLPIPHPPFVFAADGSPVGEDRSIAGFDGAPFLERVGNLTVYRSGYREQSIHTMDRAADLMRRILARDRSDPVIVLMGDHGPRPHYHFQDLARSDVAVASATTIAIRLPGNRRIPPVDSAVNVFRRVLSEVFAADYPPLPDRQFYYISLPGNAVASGPVDVSDRARAPRGPEIERVPARSTGAGVNRPGQTVATQD